MSRTSLACELDREDDIPMTDLARRMAHELWVATATAEHCQDAVSKLVSDGPTHDIMMRLQGLDGITQHLAALAGLLSRMAEMDALGAASARVLDDITLADVKRRLAGAAPIDPSDTEPEMW